MRILSTLLFLLAVAPPLSARVTESEQKRWYPVSQRLGNSLQSALNSASPVRENGKIFHGHTAWNIRWSFRWDRNASGLCEIVDHAIHLSVITTLPELKTGTFTAQTEFQRYLRALELHEEGHKKIAQDAAHSVDRTFKTLPAMTSCKALETEAQRQGSTILESARKAGAEYDATTKHGHTQGACLSC